MRGARALKGVVQRLQEGNEVSLRGITANRVLFTDQQE
jgi:hypothetical protein